MRAGPPFAFSVRPLTALALAALAAGAISPARAIGGTASLPAIERQVMCVTCKIPLNVAESPQADRERAYIQSLIDSGADEAQVKHALVAQYGRAVLALPAAHGFDLAAYLVPAAVVAALVAGGALLLVRWRRRAPAASSPHAPPPLSDSDSARLDADLARFD
jgi:cytochrome c-type biogenesis protein CcmH